VLVSFVERGSEAAEAGLTPGDVILEVDGSGIADIQAFRRSLEEVDRTSPFLIRASRGNDTRFLLLVPRHSEAAQTSPPTPSGG
jgi:S1-C subfamily serine protease